MRKPSFVIAVFLALAGGFVGSPCNARHTAPPPPEAKTVKAILAQAPPASTERALNIVLVAGPKDHGPGEHDYPLWQKRWKVLLGGAGDGDEPVLNTDGPSRPVDRKDLSGAENVRVDTAWEWPSDAQWKTADLVVVFSAPPWNDQRLSQLETYLGRGGGLVVIHMAVWHPSPKLLSLIGTAYRDGAAYRHGPMSLRIADPKNPICLGLPREIKLVDESYFALAADLAKAGVVGTSRETRPGESTPRDEPMLWSLSRAGGRVFVCIPGHYLWTFDDPLFRILLLRGMAWAAGESPYRFDPLVLRGARVKEDEPAGPDSKALDAAVAALVDFGWGDSRLALAPIDETIRRRDAGAAADLEKRLTAALAKGLPPAGCDFVCRRLAQIGTARSVPALASLLSDKDRAATARWALARIPDDAAGAALLASLSSTSGPARVEVVRAIGSHRYQPATATLLKLLSGENRQDADAALAALAEWGAPEAVEPALARNDAPVDSLLTLAARLGADGRREPARKIYDRLAASPLPQVRAAVLRGLVLLEPDRAAERLSAVLAGNDARLRGQAVSLVTHACDEACAAAVVERFNTLPKRSRQALLAASWTRLPSLGRRCALLGMASDDSDVRRDAIRLLGIVGTAEDLETLAKATGDANAGIAAAAVAALRCLAAEGTYRTIVENLSTFSGNERLALIRAARERQISQAVPVLLELTQSPDAPTRIASLHALETLGDPPTASLLIPRLLAAQTPEERAAAERAVWLCARRAKDPRQRAEPLLRAIEGATDEDRAVLLPVLGRLGGPRALEIVHQARKSPSTAQRTAAARALSNWPDAAVADDLLELARENENDSQRIAALRGYIRVVTLRGARPDHDTLTMLRPAMELATRVEEKRLILSRLSAIVVPESLELALSYLGQVEVQPEAIAASTRLAELLLPNHPEAAKAAMKKILNVTTDRKLRDRLERQLKK
ncbi:MAG: ThuA domain-containing protein [Pirellulales bacterium]|nr:ThuA domain-containing protein [Pirellulales bacterium]